MKHITDFDINDYHTVPVPNCGYLDLENEYYILVSLNEEASSKMVLYKIYDFDYDGIDKDMLCLRFHEDTFNYMSPYIFNILNSKVNLDFFISPYEEAYIDTPEMIEEAIDAMKLILRNTDDKAVIDFGKILLEMLQIAKENNTIVGFLF